jgi:hypothetical protein
MPLSTNLGRFLGFLPIGLFLGLASGIQGLVDTVRGHVNGVLSLLDDITTQRRPGGPKIGIVSRRFLGAYGELGWGIDTVIVIDIDSRRTSTCSEGIFLFSRIIFIGTGNDVSKGSATVSSGGATVTVLGTLFLVVVFKECSKSAWFRGTTTIQGVTVDRCGYR